MGRRRILCVVAAGLLALTTNTAHAQYYQIANQAADMLTTALFSGRKYKGFAEAAYFKGVGNTNADFLDISTTHGFQYNSLFYVGLGIGVDILFPQTKDNWGHGWNQNYDTSSTGVLIPLYTDLRFTPGNIGRTSVFIDIRIGASFVVSSGYIRINDGFLTSDELFYLRPSVGVRIPVGQKEGKQAVSIGVNYKLLTSNYWYNNDYSVTLNSFGVSLGFEW